METEKLQETIPAWVEKNWNEAVEKLAAVGLVKLQPGLRQVTKILLPDGQQITTPTTMDVVEERIDLRVQAGDEWIEVASLDFEDSLVRVKIADIRAYFAALHDDSFPEHQPVQVTQQQLPGNGIDLTQLRGGPRR